MLYSGAMPSEWLEAAETLRSSPGGPPSNSVLFWDPDLSGKPPDTKKKSGSSVWKESSVVKKNGETHLLDLAF